MQQHFAQCELTLPATKTKFVSEGTQGMEQIRVYYANTRSLKNKLPELELLVRSSVYDIIAFCETWLDDHVLAAWVEL